MSGKGVIRSIKNVAKGFSDVQIKVREATSNDPWGPSGTLLKEIAENTYNEADFIEIVDMIDRRLNDKGKNWRHVFKALLVYEYCLYMGSENVVLFAKENIYVIRALKTFQHLDENGKDVGVNVRQKAEAINNLLMDETKLREQRRQRRAKRDGTTHSGETLNESLRTFDHSIDHYSSEDAEFQKAIAESERMAAEEEKKRLQREAELNNELLRIMNEQKEKERLEKEKAAKSLPFTQQQLQDAFDVSRKTPSEPLDTGFNPFQQTTQSTSQNQRYTIPVLQPQITGSSTTSFHISNSDMNQQRSSPPQNHQTTASTLPSSRQFQAVQLPQEHDFSHLPQWQQQNSDNKTTSEIRSTEERINALEETYKQKINELEKKVTERENRIKELEQMLSRCKMENDMLRHDTGEDINYDSDPEDTFNDINYDSENDDKNANHDLNYDSSD